MVVISLTISAITALIAGIIILIWPRALSVIVSIWLILYGILQLIANLL